MSLVDTALISELCRLFSLDALKSQLQSIHKDDEHEPNAGMVDDASVAATEYKSLGL